MYGKKENALWPRIFLTANHLAAICVVFWLLFLGGIESIGLLPGAGWQSGDFYRRILIQIFAVVYFARILMTSFYLLKRKMEWSESLTITVWLYIVYFTFALLGGTNSHPVGFADAVAVLLFVIGSYLNTGSEYQRKVWKEDPANKGKLYTRGLFRYSMHINYFGDFVLFSGFALVTGSIYAFVIPALMFLLFRTINIPMLDSYLKEKYGADFENYRANIKRFVPFIY